MSTPAQNSRFLDKTEQFFSMRRINNCGMMMEVEVCESHEVNYDLLRRAVTETQLRHPNLRMCHDFENGRWTPVEVAEGNFQLMPKMTETWQKFLKNCANKDIIDDKSCPFEVIVHPESSDLLRIFMIYHHSIADGLSRMNIVNDILSAYAGLVTDSNFKHEYLPSLPNLLDLTFPEGLSEEQTVEVDDIARKEMEMYKSLNTNLSLPSKEAGPGNDTIYHEGSPEKLQLLIHACHREKVTIGCLAAAATAFALAKLNRKASTTDLMFLVNLRTRMDIKEHIGLHLIGALLREKVELDTNLWHLARTTGSYVKDYLSSGKHFLKVAVTEKDLIDFKTISEDYARMLSGSDDSIYDHRIGDITLSNHGKWSTSSLKNGALTVKRLHVCTSRHVYPQCLLIHSIGYMCYSMNHRDDVISRRDADQVLRHVVSLLEGAERLTSEFKFKDFLDEN